MEGELWSEVYRIVYEENSKRIRPKGVQFPDGRILEVYFWAVIHDRPTRWACRRQNWPLQQRWRDLPCDATMSVRLRTISVCLLLQAVLDRLHASDHPALVRVLDSKPLPVGCYSKDQDADWGWAATAQARGYKLFCAWGSGVVPDAWTLGPMSASDPEVGVKLVPQLEAAAYVLGDAGHDSNPLHAACADCGCQLVAPRKRPETSLGHRVHEPGRLRSVEMLEWPVLLGTAASPFARDLYAMRKQIERTYGNLCGFGGGLQPLPSWVRTPHRVAFWVAGKLVINALRRCANAGLAA
ncbi:MAG: transposase [Tepidisphaeraceae bacterium]